MTQESNEINQAMEILKALGLPRAQQNERSALTLLALLNIEPGKSWSVAETPLIGITPIMEFALAKFGREYAPNTRETFRRQTMHQFVDAGIALYNPDDPGRSVNSPKAVYQIEPTVLGLIHKYGTDEWGPALEEYLKINQGLAAKYANEREMQMVPVQIGDGKKIDLSAGDHSVLIKAIVEEFAPRYVHGAVLVYAGDTGEKFGFFDEGLLKRLGVEVDMHGKMPDVVLYYPEKNWVVLVESVTSHGPVDGKRHDELKKLFEKCSAGLVFVTAFPSRKIMKGYLPFIAWETEVWCADAPTHLIHFNGSRFLGPYDV
ncbi:MAG TPA: BsuBI/PstI family type II restriction endonuclease [Bacteroidia bacterium]|nr:BsuBI/PstI family type II restriction endonuclease [Bacteroidia bacterium]